MRFRSESQLAITEAPCANPVTGPPPSSFCRITISGSPLVFTGSGLLLLSAMVIVFAAVRVKPVARADQPVTGHREMVDATEQPLDHRRGDVLAEHADGGVLRIDEATHPLAFLAVGLYGRTLPNQNGAPIRLVVPWKYGFKGIKSIAKIRFTDKMPLNEMHLGLIALLFPQSPLVHVIRHPLDVMVSAISNHFTHGLFCASALETAATHYVRIMALVQKYRAEMALRYLPVRYEDMVEDQEATVRSILDYSTASANHRRWHRCAVLQMATSAALRRDGRRCPRRSRAPRGRRG